MTRPGDDNLRDRLRRALPVAMKARDRPAMAALRSALAAIDNAEAVDPAHGWSDGLAWDPGPAGWEAADTGAGVVDAGHPGFAGTVAGVGATEAERRSLSPAQMEDIVRAEIEDREVAAAALERAGQREPAERLRAEVRVLLSHVNRT
ncbi:MAG TPA: hypothetical protein VHS79_18250 [Actinomycetes bacterium]|jgi:uncharacterized protein YqeY|nr:hypothetical protein [Actinomycetes bacterium]